MNMAKMYTAAVQEGRMAVSMQWAAGGSPAVLLYNYVLSLMHDEVVCMEDCVVKKMQKHHVQLLNDTLTVRITAKAGNDHAMSSDNRVDLKA